MKTNDQFDIKSVAKSKQKENLEFVKEKDESDKLKNLFMHKFPNKFEK